MATPTPGLTPGQQSFYDTLLIDDPEAAEDFKSAGRNGNLTTPSAPSNIAMPYTVGVGRGSPRTWLGANVILWGAKMVHSRRPEYANYDKVM